MTVSKANVPTPEMLRKLLEYDPETGCLTWKKRTPDLFDGGKQTAEHNCTKWNSRFDGKAAFTSRNSCGYFHGTIFKHKLKASRVIWAMETGSWPKRYIDHINGIRDDNRLENLRDVSNEENCKNRAMSKRNTSGVMGVSFDKRCGKWVARIGSNGKELHLGYFTSKFDAVEARHAAETKHSYHENHGRTHNEARNHNHHRPSGITGSGGPMQAVRRYGRAGDAEPALRRPTI